MSVERRIELGRERGAMVGLAAGFVVSACSGMVLFPAVTVFCTLGSAVGGSMGEYLSKENKRMASERVKAPFRKAGLLFFPDVYEESVMDASDEPGGEIEGVDRDFPGRRVIHL